MTAPACAVLHAEVALSLAALEMYILEKELFPKGALCPHVVLTDLHPASTWCQCLLCAAAELLSNRSLAHLRASFFQVHPALVLRVMRRAFEPRTTNPSPALPGRADVSGFRLPATYTKSRIA